MSFKQYVDHGWKLCVVERGTKGPVTKGWNLREGAVSNPAVAEQLVGAGLCHAWSGTCALDIDHYEHARAYLLDNGIDLDGLMTAPESVQIHSGKVGRGKLLYKLPKPLASLKLASYRAMSAKTNKEETYHGFELRCANATGSTVQDVLPPTIHPETCRPYEWRYGDDLVGDWRVLPDLPQALHDLWVRHLQPASAAGVQQSFGAEAEEILKLIADQDASSYDNWLRVGMAIHHETGGSNEGLAIFDKWSQGSSKYEGFPAVQAKWCSFRSNTENAVTLASLRKDAVAKASDFAPVVAAATATPGGDLAGAGREPVAGADLGEDTRPDAVMQRIVGDNVVYVRNIDLYFDLRVREPYESDRAVRNDFSPLIPQMVREGKKGAKEYYKLDPVNWLMNSKVRRDRDVSGIAMHPGQPPIFVERGRRYANAFQLASNCALHPDVKPLVPKPAEREVWEFVWGCLLSPVFASWLKKYYAYALKNPGAKVRSAPLLVSTTTGTGKTTLMNCIPKLLFGHVEQLTESQMRSQFNGELLNAWWATIEEIYAGNTKAERRYIADKMKPWITNDDLPIHKKGQTPFSIVNRAQFTASSNHLDALQLEDDEERRWGVCGVREQQWTPAQSLSVYGDLLGTERAPGVLKYLIQQESLVGFHPAAKPPATGMKRVMVAAGLGGWESALIERMAACEAPFNRDVFTLSDVMASQINLEGLTMHKLARLLRGKPFFCEPILAGMRSHRMWAWRNHGAWRHTSEADRLLYMETGKRPFPSGSDEIPKALAAMRAEAPDADSDENCDLI